MESDMACDYIHLGDTLRYLFNAEGEKHDKVMNKIGTAINHINEFGFIHTKSHTSKLSKIKIEIDSAKYTGEFSKGGLTPRFSESLKDSISPIITSLRSESKDRHLARLFKDDTSDALRNLSYPDNEVLQVLLDNTIRCLECGANHAAIVMGWNLAYEMVRRWIYDDEHGRRSQFNQELLSRKWDEIIEYNDFFKMRESVVLDMARIAGFLKKDKFEVLEEKLRKRNQFAHPSFVKTTSKIAAGYIDDLIVNILTDSQFNLPS